MMENLNMTYSEVMNTEYSLLLMLQHDKPRADYGNTEEVERATGKEMLKRKRR